MTYPTRQAMIALNRALRLPATGREQDWDLELADPDRVSEFATYLEDHALSHEEKFGLMALILGSLEDFTQRENVSQELTSKIRRLLKANRALYTDLIERWVANDSGPDSFAISLLLQSLSEIRPNRDKE